MKKALSTASTRRPPIAVKAQSLNICLKEQPHNACWLTARGRPLRASEKRFNTLISKRRFRVEQCFGTMKRLFGLHRARYFGQAKTHAQLAMAAISQNLLKAANKIKITPKAPKAA